MIKNWEPYRYNPLRHTINKKIFSGLEHEIKRKRIYFNWQGKSEKFDVLAERKVILSWLVNPNMVKPEKFDHLHLVNHFTVPLSNLKVSVF